MTKVIANALKALNEMIAEGREYPDAHAEVATAFQLTDKQAEELTAAYDEQG